VKEVSESPPRCIDCEKPLPGYLVIASGSGAGVVWICDSCQKRYSYEEIMTRMRVKATDTYNKRVYK
jgi:hypothetical protein